jgi:alginate O-acetyltransferase complex protein AlgJ
MAPDLERTQAAKAATTAAGRRADRVLIALFLAGIALPALGTLGGIRTGQTPGEHRFMAPAPKLGPGGVGELRRQTDAWFNDHFGFRNTLTAAFSLLDYEVFGVSSTPDVVLGQAPWLFYARDYIIENLRGRLPFSTHDLQRWQAQLEERRDWLARRGIRYVFLIAPEKSTIYPELLPAALQPVAPETRIDQLLAWMAAHSTVDLIDVRPALRAAKTTGRLYRWTDTHWNGGGAFAAHHRLEEWLQARFPELRPIDRASFSQHVRVAPGGDLAGMLALAGHLREEELDLVWKEPPAREGAATPVMNAHASAHPVAKECPGGELGRTVVIHDSFFEAIVPFLARHFRRAAFVRREFATDIIADEKPEIVIEEMVERYLNYDGFRPDSAFSTGPQ